MCPDLLCKQEVAICDLKMLLPPKLLDKFYDRTFNQAAGLEQDISWCPTPGCEYAFVFDDGQTDF